MSSSNCCFLTCIQISQEVGQVVWYSHLFHNFPQFIVIHTVKGFGIVNKAEIDVFLELSCFFHHPADGNLISRSSAFFKTSLNIWKFTLHVLLKPGLENFEHYFTSMWDECNCAVFWAFFGIAFLWDWNENWPFPVLWTNLDSILKSRDITLLTKVCIIKAVVFSVVMYRCEGWTTKKAECWITDAFILCYWIRLLRVPRTARRLNQDLKEINHECWLKVLMLKLQYFGHQMQRARLLEKTLMMGETKAKGGEMVR